MNLQALSLGLYVHVPFCANQCDYCHFFKQRPERKSVDMFLKKIKYESDFWKSQFNDREVETIFWGGGSPSCLSVEDMMFLGACCPQSKSLREWSVEVSPTSITPEKLQCLKELGVSRISIGVQSFNAHILKKLGRHQTNEMIFKAYAWIREAGFKNINLDLIFPPDFSSIELWQQDLLTAIKLSPEHISTYCLTYENATGPFTPEQHALVNVDREAEFYKFTWHFLQNNGYEHYEVSNFAKPGFQCLHNLNTWRMQEWIGLGPSAASQYNMQRFQNPSNLSNWINGISNHRESITCKTLCDDCLIFGLRTCAGVQLDELQQRFPSIDLEQYKPLWKFLIQKGLLQLTHNRLHCTERGLLLADSIALEII